MLVILSYYLVGLDHDDTPLEERLTPLSFMVDGVWFFEGIVIIDQFHCLILAILILFLPL